MVWWQLTLISMYLRQCYLIEENPTKPSMDLNILADRIDTTLNTICIVECSTAQVVSAQVSLTEVSILRSDIDKTTRPFMVAPSSIDSLDGGFPKPLPLHVIGWCRCLPFSFSTKNIQPVSLVSQPVVFHRGQVSIHRQHRHHGNSVNDNAYDTAHSFRGLASFSIMKQNENAFRIYSFGFLVPELKNYIISNHRRHTGASTMLIIISSQKLLTVVTQRARLESKPCGYRGLVE